jgi:hypothetical protein
VIEEVIGERLRDQIMTRLLRSNPRLRGASLADVLSMGWDTDNGIQWTEPFWESGVAEGILKDAGDEGESAHELIGYCILATAYAHARTPERDEVAELFQRARVIQIRGS